MQSYLQSEIFLSNSVDIMKNLQKIPYSSIIPWSIFVADGLSLLMILWDIFLLTSDPFCDKNYLNVASKIFWSQSMLDFFFVYHTTLTLTLAMLCCNGKVVRVVRPFLHCFSALANSVKKFFPFFSFFLFCNEKKVDIEATEEEQSELKWQI